MPVPSLLLQDIRFLGDNLRTPPRKKFKLSTINFSKRKYFNGWQNTMLSALQETILRISAPRI